MTGGVKSFLIIYEEETRFLVDYSQFLNTPLNGDNICASFTLPVSSLFDYNFFHQFDVHPVKQNNKQSFTGVANKSSCTAIGKLQQ